MNKLKNVVVLLGRFQHSTLPESVLEYIDKLSVNDISEIPSSNIVICVKIPKSYDTKRFPLPFNVISQTFKSYNREFNVIPVIEHIDGKGNINDELIIQDVKKTVSLMYPGCNILDVVTFIHDELSCTYSMSEHPQINDSFRDGMIYQATTQRDKATIAADIVPIHDGKALLGRKPGEKQYRFIGGHVDPTDVSIEMAALRELEEETGISYSNLDTIDNTYYALNRLKFLGTKCVEDPRYANNSNRIFTVFYKLEMLKSDGVILGYAKPGDDIEEIKWFTKNELVSMQVKNEIRFEHQPLLEMLLNNWD